MIRYTLLIFLLYYFHTALKFPTDSPVKLQNRRAISKYKSRLLEIVDLLEFEYADMEARLTLTELSKIDHKDK